MSEPAVSDAASGHRRFDCTTADSPQLSAAADAARAAVESGECIVLPTDTVYGIGADAFSPAAVQRLLDAKHRGRDMPPPVLMGDASLIRALATDVPEVVKELVEQHWPGPLTVICKIQPSLRMDLGDTDGTIALRVPDHELAREVLRGTGPMAVSSANISGRPAALTCDDAVDQLGDAVSVYLDGGALGDGGGAPSTIVDFTKNPAGEVLRIGALTTEVLRRTLPDLVDLSGPAAGPGEPLGSGSQVPPVDPTPDEDLVDPTQPDPSHPGSTQHVQTQPDSSQHVQTQPDSSQHDPTQYEDDSDEDDSDDDSDEAEAEDSVLFEDGVAWGDDPDQFDDDSQEADRVDDDRVRPDEAAGPDRVQGR